MLERATRRSASDFVVGEEGRREDAGGGSGVGTFFLVLLFYELRPWTTGPTTSATWKVRAPGCRDGVNGLKDNIDELLGRKTPTPAGYFEPLGDFGGGVLSGSEHTASIARRQRVRVVHGVDETRRRRGGFRLVKLTVAFAFVTLASFPRGLIPTPTPSNADAFVFSISRLAIAAYSFPTSLFGRAAGGAPRSGRLRQAGSSRATPPTAPLLLLRCPSLPLFPNTYVRSPPGPTKYAMFSTNPRMGALTLAYMSSLFARRRGNLPAGWRR